MTTRHVVADDLLGQIARKQWELTRRVLQGTLDPHRLLDSLQQLIEGQPIRLPCEDLGFTISEQVYSVSVQRKGAYEEVARTCLGLEYFSVYHDPPECWLEIPEGTGPKRVSLRLAMFTTNCTFTAASIKLRGEGYTPADAWDLLAFYKKAPMCRTVPSNGPRIYALGTIVRSYFQDPYSTSGKGRFVELRALEQGHSGKPHARWSLESADAEWDQGSYVHEGQYVLVRDT